MQNNNEKHEKFITELFETFLAIDLKRIQEIKVFFSEAFLIHTSDEIFDDGNYRQEWADLINWMNDLSRVTNKVDHDEFDAIINKELLRIEKLESHA